MVALFLRYNADITPKRRGVYNTLHTAVCNGHVGVIEAILAHRSELINAKQPLKPLYAASIWGCWKAVESLMKFPGADPNEKHIRGWTPLTASCDNGFSRTVRVLLDRDVDPNIPGPGDKWTAVYYAAAIRGDADIVRMLLARGAAIDHKVLEEPLLCGIINNVNLSEEDKISLFEILIQHDPSMNVDKGMSDGLAPLMLAAMDGNANMITWLLRHGADINLTTPSGRHALFFALANRRIAATKELLEHDTSPILDMEDEHAGFPLEVALADEDTRDDGELVEMLLEAGANLEFENKNKVTVFTIAVYRGQKEVVKLLLKRGVDINHRDVWDYTPLLVSIQSKAPASTEVMRLLVDSGANLNDRLPGDSTVLHVAMWEADLDKVRILLEFHTSIDVHSQDSDGDTPLLVSTNWDRPQIVECLKLLVRAGADVNAQNLKGWCLLMKSSWRREAASAVHDFLLSLPETNVDIFTPASGYPLQVACRIGYEPLLRKLLGRGANVNLAVPGFAPTALISACLADSAKSDETVELIVRKLVAEGAEPNFMSKNTVGLFNALCAASFQARVGTINFLLDSGASVQQPDRMGRLPIHFAAANGLRNFEAVALAYTGDIMAVDKADKNVLHWAAQFGNCETVKAILERIPVTERKAVVDCKDSEGWTPLAWAMRPVDLDPDFAQGFPEPRNYAGTVQYLIQQGANVAVTFRQGRGEAAEVLAPVELAQRCGADDLVQLLVGPQNRDNDNIDTDAAGEKHASRSARYISRQTMCYMCFSVRFCKKCHSNVELYHMVDDGKLHTFGINSDGAEEYMAPNSPSSPASSKAMNTMTGTAVNADGDSSDLATGQSNHDSPQDDVTEVVDFSDLKDLGSFTDSE
ncbi:hypothetical protein INS49_015369 [Diaporthe citri]|uniref:uncharacterized protein n=1 Tax=Diaporthe citri TaxID=83186 RepID=UPI001C7FBD64|nr:uncharacterized protein INS49_015369 [Diaporthe citri]KAG6355984.1 hypothetical protein INS49_015369 [Diaporthe citri]